MKRNDQLGASLVLIATSMTVIFAAAAMSLDVAYGKYAKVRLQRAADSASLLAVKGLHGGGTPSTLAAEMFTANGIDSSSITAVECGVLTPSNHNSWSPFQRCQASCPNSDAGITCSSECTDCSSNSANAVRVTAQQQLPTFFARVIGATTMTPQVTSVAMGISANSSNCVKPFAIVGSGGQNVLSGVSVGGTFTITKNSPGNWGRLSPDGLINGSNRWEEAMRAGYCHSDFTVNSPVDVATGSVNLGDILSGMQSAGLTDKMYVPVVSSFPNGQNNGGTVNVLSFAVISLVSITNGSGGNFTAVFKLDEKDLSDVSNGSGTGTITDRYLRS